MSFESITERCDHVRLITVSRQFGSGGEAIAQATAESLGFRYLDGEVITRAAEEAGASVETVSEAEHIPSLRQRMLHALAANPGLSAAGWFQPSQITAPGPFMTSAHYRHFIESVVQEIAREGEAVILGHAGQVVLADRWDTLKVLVTGSTERRGLRLAEHSEATDRTETDRALGEWDDGRRAFYERCYGIDWLSPLNYDLCLNTDHMSLPEATDAIVSAARRR